MGAKEKWRKRRDEEADGCIRQQVADALWELAGRFEVGVWYEYVRVGTWVNQYDVFWRCREWGEAGSASLPLCGGVC